MTPRTLAMLTTAAALAAQPVWASGDARVRSRFYDADQVVTVRGKAGFQSTIAFAPDERIENIAVGDSAAWSVTPNRRANLLFVKPVAAKRTNMTVVTSQRTYLFDLAPAARGAAPVYQLAFTYPAPPPAPPVVEPPVILTAAPPAPAPSPIDLNFAWTSKGARRLLPSRVFDDGHATFLAWNMAQGVPAVLAIGPDGAEGPVNYSVKGDYLVVDGVPSKLVLRAGKEFAVLATAHGERPDPDAPDPTLVAER